MVTLKRWSYWFPSAIVNREEARENGYGICTVSSGFPAALTYGAYGGRVGRGPFPRTELGPCILHEFIAER